MLLTRVESYPLGVRVFKAAWFSKAAKKARIRDDELCRVAKDAIAGLGVDLGGGVFKKRLNKNMHRAIILAKADRFWIFEYLFAKNDRDNIDDRELDGFRKLVEVYATLTPPHFEALLDARAFTEICHDSETQVQK